MPRKYAILSSVLALTSALLGKENEAPAKQLPVCYVSYQQLFPGQVRYSSQNVKEKVNNALDSKAAVFDESSQLWIYKYHNGTSILPEHKALPVLSTSFGYVLADGHHDVLASIQLRAEMIPIKVVKDLSDLGSDEFWSFAEQNGLVYLFSIGGEWRGPCRQFSDLEDDPNRYFAAVSARKYTLNAQGDYTIIGPEYPLWIKVGKDIPFIEFKIADALYKEGFIYPLEEMSKYPSEDLTEKAREILLKADIQGLRLIPTRTHCDQIVF